jgi:hypothetical protein
MDKKMLIKVGGMMIVIIANYLVIFDSEDSDGTPNLNCDNLSNVPKLNCHDGTWLKIVAHGDDGYTVRLHDKKLYVYTGIASYNPSKVGNCPHAMISVLGCGMDYTGYADEEGFAEIPVQYNKTGILTISCKYGNYGKIVKIHVEE